MEHYTPLRAIDTKQQSVKCKLTSSKNIIFDFFEFRFFFYFLFYFCIKIKFNIGAPVMSPHRHIYTDHPLRMPANALLNQSAGMTMTD